MPALLLAGGVYYIGMAVTAGGPAWAEYFKVCMRGCDYAIGSIYLHLRLLNDMYTGCRHTTTRA